jgi:protein-L-isoaspartate(D-aspartate) O-methyltransferase
VSWRTQTVLWRSATADDLPASHGCAALAAALIKETDRVLEVGTGSGYQAAVLAELAREVVGVELVPELVEWRVRTSGRWLRARRSASREGDELGWRAGAPYDVIVVAAASPRVPMSLVDQLAPGGRLYLPVGDREKQDLVRAEKRALKASL